MRISNDIKLDFQDVLISPKRSQITSRADVSLHRKFKYKNKPISGIPICASNMHTTGSFDVGRVMTRHNMFVALSKHYEIEEYINFFNEDNLNADQNLPNHIDHCFLTAGMSSTDREKVDRVVSGLEKTPMICLDIANGYTQKFLNEVRHYASTYPDAVILAGNVCTPEMTEALILEGAHIVKIGIGPGACCLTRKVTGVGFPQISAIIECADAAHGLDGYVMSDGGCSCIGDVSKAFCAGADFVMLGTMLAGHTECNGKIIEGDDGKLYQEHYGMSSNKAMKDHGMGKKTYRASEGRETRVPYRGPIAPTLEEIQGGIRSTASYIGARQIKYMSKCAHFVRCYPHSQLNTSLQ